MFTDISLSQQLIIDVSSVLGFSQHMVVWDVADGSEVHAAVSTFRAKVCGYTLQPTTKHCNNPRLELISNIMLDSVQYLRYI